MSEERKRLLRDRLGRFKLRLTLGQENALPMRFVGVFAAGAFLLVLTTEKCLSAVPYSMAGCATRWKSRYLETCLPTLRGEISLSDAVSIGLANSMCKLIAKGPLLRTDNWLSYPSALQSRFASDESGASSSCCSAYHSAIVLAVREAYWDAAWRQAKLDLASEKLAHKKAVVQLWDQSSQGSTSEASKNVEAGIANAHEGVKKASQLYSDALLKLKNVLRVSPTSLVSPKDQLSYGEEVRGKYDLDELLHIAGNSRIDAANARAQMDWLRFLFGLATRNTVYAIDTAINIDNPTSNYLPGQMDDGIISDTTGMMDVAGCLAQNLLLQQDELARVEVNVAQDVTLRWIDFDTDIRSVEIARNLVFVMQRNFDDCQKDYATRKILSEEESEVAEYFFESRESLLDATYRLRLAEARLLYATGSL